MATFTKRDLQGIFLLLSIAYLLISFVAGFEPTWVFVFIILAIFSWFGVYYRIGIPAKDSEFVVRFSVVVVFLGLLIGDMLIMAVGLVAGMLLLAMDISTITVDIMALKVTATHETTKRHGSRG